MKKCNRCLSEKELDMFPKTGTKCKECIAEYKKNYALLNKEKIKEYKENYYLENKESITDSKKIYYKKNKDIISLKVREYSINNADKIREYKEEYNKNNPNLEYHKEYREFNKESISLKRKEYYQKNKDRVKSKVNTYRKENKDQVNQRKKENRDKNKEHYNSLNREYIRNKKENNPLFRLTCSIRTLITQSFKGKYTKKSKKTVEILGCDFNTFKEHIESQFTEKMTWDNYAIYWQLDHKVPISWAENEDDVYRLNHYTNFQPMYWKDNITKGNKWED